MRSSISNRRRVLRGMLNGGAVTVALPLLDCFLNNNGTALAATGAQLPIRFGTWFWGLGMNPSIFTPKKIGADYDLPEEIEALKDVKRHINILSNYRVTTDGRANLCHYSGWVALRCGQAPAGRGDIPGESIDISISDRIGDGTRFRSVQLAATGALRDTYSMRSADAVNVPEVSAVSFYRSVFGPDFLDPNAPTFTPNPKIMVRKSVFSAVLEQYNGMKNAIGAADRERMDQYFTSVRELEGRLALQLQKPPPAVACIVPKGAEKETQVGIDWEDVRDRHNAMTDILVWALACNQTNVFNMVQTNANSGSSKKGLAQTHHTVTHEEMIDAKLGYQPQASWFTRRVMDSWAYFVKALATVKEGDGTILDRSLVFAHSDQELAKIHSINGIPMMTAGTAGGRVKTGLHVDGRGEVASRLGFTLLKVMDVPVSEWGAGSMRAQQTISEILV